MTIKQLLRIKTLDQIVTLSFRKLKSPISKTLLQQRTSQLVYCLVLANHNKSTIQSVELSQIIKKCSLSKTFLKMIKSMNLSNPFKLIQRNILLTHQMVKYPSNNLLMQPVELPMRALIQKLPKSLRMSTSKRPTPTQISMIIIEPSELLMVYSTKTTQLVKPTYNQSTKMRKKKIATEVLQITL